MRHLTLKYINLTFSYIDLTFVHINLTNQFITENMGDSLNKGQSKEETTKTTDIEYEKIKILSKYMNYIIIELNEIFEK